MARPRKAELIPLDGVEDVFEVMESEEQKSRTAHDSALDEIIEELSANGSQDTLLYIYRQSPLGGNKPMAQLEILPVDKYTNAELFMFLRDNYGAGDYRIHIKRGREFLANKLITVELPKAEKKGGGTPLGETGELLQTLLDRQQRQHDAMLELLASTKGGQGSKSEWYREMLLIKQLFQNDNPPPAVNGISQLKEAMELLSTLGFGHMQNQDNDGFGALLEKMSPVITAAIESGHRQPTRYPPQAQPQAQPQPQPQAQNDMNLLLRAGFMQLINAAKKNSDPGTYAVLILDNMSEEAIRDYITAPDALDKLKRFHPMVEVHLPWFVDLGEHVKALLGMPSSVSDLYEAEEPAITEETTSTTPIP